jgi:hypothetical protein
MTAINALQQKAVPFGTAERLIKVCIYCLSTQLINKLTLIRVQSQQT